MRAECTTPPSAMFRVLVFGGLNMRRPLPCVWTLASLWELSAGHIPHPPIPRAPCSRYAYCLSSRTALVSATIHRIVVTHELPYLSRGLLPQYLFIFLGSSSTIVQVHDDGGIVPTCCNEQALWGTWSRCYSSEIVSDGIRRNAELALWAL